jgi:hypothetical protein
MPKVPFMHVTWISTGSRHILWFGVATEVAAAVSAVPGEAAARSVPAGSRTLLAELFSSRGP